MTKLGGVKTTKRIEKGFSKSIEHYGLQENNFLIDGLTIESRFAGIKKAHFSDGNYHTADNHYKIYLIFKNKTISFDFWTSYAKPNITSIEDLQGALECIISNALSGSNYVFMSDADGIQEMMVEFGCKDVNEAIRVFNDLKKSYIEMTKIFGASTDDKLNEIWEILTQ